jgi:hypothetical protein
MSSEGQAPLFADQNPLEESHEPDNEVEVWNRLEDYREDCMLRGIEEGVRRRKAHQTNQTKQDKPPDEDIDSPADGQTNIAPDLFAFRLEDCVAIEKLIAGIRKVLKRDRITPQKIVGLGKLLHGLQRLPRSTPGIDIEVSTGHRSNDNCFYQSLHLSESEFEISSGGAEYTPGVGSDSYTAFSFLVEVGGSREEKDVVELENWISGFIASLCDDEQEFEIDDHEEDSALDWNEVIEDYWDRLESG